MEIDYEIFLINNDNSEIDKLSIYNKISLIKNNKPLSFAANVNQGISKAIKSKKNLIFLNNDIIFTENWVHSLNTNISQAERFGFQQTPDHE